MEKRATLLAKRAALHDKMKAISESDGPITDDQQKEFNGYEAEVKAIDASIALIDRARAVVEKAPVADQDAPRAVVADDDPDTNEDAAKRRGLKTHRGLRAVACAKMFDAAGRSLQGARELAQASFGERHPIVRAFEPRRDPSTRALVVSVGASGGFIVPPDYMNEIIELLRPQAVVRGAGPRVIPMPRGTMTLPGQSAAATASYGTEVAPIASSQQTLDSIIASFKKLTALVPVTNDMMRYADPAADAFVRDDLVKVIALREDLAFLTGDGTAAGPMGFTAFANRFAVSGGGTAGVWSASGNSTAAVGGNFITSNETYNLATVASELGGLVNKLDTANVPDTKRVWFMHPRSFNYLFNVQNSLGVYVYRDELTRGTLLGYPFKKTTQLPINIHDTSSTNTDCSFVILAEMDEAMILDSMSLELAVSREGTYVDANSVTWSAFQSDQTLIRAIAEHDFQIRHDAAVAVAQFVRWAPAIS